MESQIQKAFEDSWHLVNLRSGWSPARAMFFRSPHVDKIEWRRRRTGGSHRKSSGIVYRVTATLPGPKEKVVALLRDVNNIASWNRTLQVFLGIVHSGSRFANIMVFRLKRWFLWLNSVVARHGFPRLCSASRSNLALT